MPTDENQDPLADLDPLDLPCGCPDVLSKLYASWLMRLNLIPVAPAGQVAGDGSAYVKPVASSPQPIRNEVAGFNTRWHKATTNRERLDVIKAVQDTVVRLKYGPPRSRVRGTLDWKLAIAEDERASHVVAELYGISSSYVRKLRKAKRDGKLSQAPSPE